MPLQFYFDNVTPVMVYLALYTPVYHLLHPLPSQLHELYWFLYSNNFFTGTSSGRAGGAGGTVKVTGVPGGTEA